MITGCQGKRLHAAVQIEKGIRRKGTVLAGGEPEGARSFLYIEKHAAAKRLKGKRKPLPDLDTAAGIDGRKLSGGGVQQVVKGAGKICGVRYGFRGSGGFNGKRRLVLFSECHEKRLPA